MNAPQAARSVVYGDRAYELVYYAGRSIWMMSEVEGGPPFAYVTLVADKGFDVHVVRKQFSPLHVAAIFVASTPGEPRGATVFSMSHEFEGESYEIGIRDDRVWEFSRGADSKRFAEVLASKPGRVVAVPGDERLAERLARFVGAL